MKIEEVIELLKYVRAADEETYEEQKENEETILYVLHEILKELRRMNERADCGDLDSYPLDKDFYQGGSQNGI